MFCRISGRRTGSHFVWAAFGSEHSRIADFAYSPSETLGHLRGMLLLGPRHYLGHNPAGAAMIFALAFVLCGLVVTGLAIEAGEEKLGPFAGITSHAVGHAAKIIHPVLVWILAAMVVGHVAGVIVESLLTRENLVTSMITGRKELPEGAPMPALRRPRWVAALASWVVVAKLFSRPKRAILIQGLAQTRNIDSRHRSVGFDYCSLAVQQRVLQHNLP